MGGGGSPEPKPPCPTPAGGAPGAHAPPGGPGGQTPTASHRDRPLPQSSPSTSSSATELSKGSRESIGLSVGPAHAFRNLEPGPLAAPHLRQTTAPSLVSHCTLCEACAWKPEHKSGQALSKKACLDLNVLSEKPRHRVQHTTSHFKATTCDDCAHKLPKATALRTLTHATLRSTPTGSHEPSSSRKCRVRSSQWL